MIVYKVVEKKTRNCSNIAMFKQVHNVSEDFVTKTFRSTKEGKKFFPIYEKGKTIKAVEKSIGIMCFETIEKARLFKQDQFYNQRKLEVIKVEGLGKPRRNLRIVMGCGDNPSYLLRKKSHTKTNAPSGTVTFKSVKVME